MPVGLASARRRPRRQRADAAMPAASAAAAAAARRLPFLLLLLAASFICSAVADPPAVQEFVLGTQGRVLLRVQSDPWQLEVVKRRQRQPHDATTSDAAAEEEDVTAFRTVVAPRGRLGFGEWVGKDVTDRIYEGYSWRVGAIARWWHATTVERCARLNASAIGVTLLTSDKRGAKIDVTIALVPTAAERGQEEEEESIVAMDVRAYGGSADSKRANRLGMAVEAMDGTSGGGGREAVFGFGERFAGRTDKRGRELYCWAEDGSWVLGRNHVRLPKERSTYVPIPFLLSSRGPGLLLATPYRSDWRLDSPGLRLEHRQEVGGWSVDEEGALVLAEGELMEGGSEERAVTAVARRQLRGVQRKGEEDGPGAYEFVVETLSTRVLLCLGDDPANTLRLFTGPAVAPRRSLVPPPFQLGPWNQFGNEFNDTGYLEAIARFKQLDIPSSVAIDPVHFFPLGDEQGQENAIRARNAAARQAGLAPLAYFNSMVDQTFQPEYRHCSKQGLFYKRPDGTTYSFAYKGAGRKPFLASLLDFTAPGAAEWFHARMQTALDLGFKGWMYDYGEYVSPQTTAHDGQSGAAAHNLYPLQYQEAAFDFFGQQDPDPHDAYAPPYVYYVRSGYTGTQAWTWNHWTGDPYAGWDPDSGLPAQVKAQLTLGLSGLPFSGSDIGGFVWEEPPSEELWLRWVALGVGSGTMHMQTGGTSILGKPKTHVHDTRRGTRIYRKFAKLRTALFPYLYTAAHEAHATGLPLTRHHVLMFPHDREAWASPAADYQYSLGRALLLAPVLSPATAHQHAYLPIHPSGWYDVSTRLAYDERDGRFRIKGGATLLEGGQVVTLPAPLDTLPCFVKGGSILPTLDPSVATLYSPPSSVANRDVITYAERAHVLHLWAWADADGSADSGPLWDGGRVAIQPIAATNNHIGEEQQQIQPPFLLLCTITAPTSPGYPYEAHVSQRKTVRTYVLQLALPASWPHGTVRGVSRLVGVGEGEATRRSLVQAAGGWKEVAAVGGEGGEMEEGAAAPLPEDAWAWDEEEQETLWVRVSSASDLKMVLSFGE